ncbi:hypothetical protein D3C87_1784940 [compost metagenome]
MALLSVRGAFSTFGTFCSGSFGTTGFLGVAGAFGTDGVDGLATGTSGAGGTFGALVPRKFKSAFSRSATTKSERSAAASADSAKISIEATRSL